MRIRIAAATVAALLFPATEALAGDPVMPLGEVHAGLQCTGYSVVRGTDVAAFGVEVVDVVDDRAGSGPRILVKVSGPAVDETGIGPGFSGSPIYCPDAQGVARNIGAISESVGEYGGKVALATPIEAILGNPVDAPRAKAASATAAGAARPLAAPLTITGLNTRFGNALQKEAAKRGRAVLAAPAGPLGSFPVQQLKPGSAFGVGYASGDIAASAIGTVTYVDGDRVWGFGHPLDGVGARSLLLQDAYVFRVINNPLSIGDFSGTYKYAAAGHDIGTLSNDALAAVVGRVGALPATVPVKVFATDLDTGAKRSEVTNVADESGVDQPTGGSLLSFLAPIAVTQAAGTVLGGSPARLSGRACFAITLKERKQPVRFCNRYVSDVPDLSGSGNVVAAAASTDLLQALGLIDGYKASELHVTGVEVNVKISRGQNQAYLRNVRLPRRGKAGHSVTARLTLRHVRGRLERRKVRVKIPADIRPGKRRLVFTGTDVDAAEGDLSELFGSFEIDFGLGSTGGDLGPSNVRTLVASIERIGRYDGVSVRPPSRDPEDFDPGEPSYLDQALRISGQVGATIRVRR